MSARRIIIIITSLIVILVGVSVLSLHTGRYPVSMSDLFHIFFGNRPADIPGNKFMLMSEIVTSMRVPRLAAALLVGIALSMSGTTFQSIFRNPLVSPELLGIVGGALCGLTVGFMCHLSIPVIQLLAFAGGLIAVGITLLIARMYKGNRMLLIILAGIITGAFSTVVFKLLEYGIDSDHVMQNLMPWLTGDLSLAHGKEIVMLLPLLIFAVAGMLISGKALNVLSLGEEAATLGVSPKGWRLFAILCATLATALTVILAGIVAWIGLVVPHMGRLLVGQNNRLLMPVSGLIGASLLILADDITRASLSFEIPLMVTMSIIGIPVFLLLMFRANKSESMI